MAFLFQRKLVCFYCGQKSAQSWTPSVRQWQCRQCEAENHLDENGEITDPPIDDVISHARHAESLAQPTLPALTESDNPLFCSTCLKNQHLVSQALASYLPPPDAPDYAEYEKAEEEYLKGLEERYPQVCQRCEPKVQERIKAAGYAAKTDHLRRMMDRTRGHSIQYGNASWINPLVTLGGVGWFLSQAGQFLWSGLFLLKPTEGQHGLRDEQSYATASACLQQVMRGLGSLSNCTELLYSACLQQVMRGLRSLSDCTELLYSAAGLALLLSILTSWWNPMLKETSNRPSVRAVGTTEFYKLQCMLFIIRCTMWWYLPSYDLSAHQIRAAHMFLLVLLAIMNITSFRSIKLDYSTPVKFQDSPAPLVAQASEQKASGVGSRDLGYILQQPSQGITRKNGGLRPFSITDLAPSGQRHPPLYQPPTPPPEEEDNEAMDWTPSQESKILRPPTSYRTYDAISQQPRPISYREKLSPEALSQSTSLRNASNHANFRNGTEGRNRKYPGTPRKYAIRDSSDESPFATPYEPSLAFGSPNLSPVKFAQPKFFPHTDRQELGLESLMANNFSLAEEPHEIRARQQQGIGEKKTQSKMEDVLTQWHGPAALCILTIACTIWTTPVPSPAISGMHFRLAALCCAAFVVSKNLLLAIRKARDRSVSDMVLLTFELVTTIVLGATLRHRAPTSLSEDSVGPLGTPGIILMTTLIAQEAWMIYNGTWVRRMSKRDGQYPSIPQPASAPNEEDGQQPLAGSKISSIAHDPILSLVPVPNGQRLPESSQRTTRSRTKLENKTHAETGFSSLSLGGKARNDPALGMNSLNLGHPQGRNRNGMW